MAKECTLSTGQLPPEGLSRNGAVRITDYPDMTSALNKTNKTYLNTTENVDGMFPSVFR